MAFGTLYVVATPIGNLADASPRSIEVLRAVDLVACEDTRTSATLFARFGIAARAVPLHQHNERTAAAGLIEALRRGKSVALVTDAGTPALSDPGAGLVARAHREGIRVSPVPGPSAAAAAFSAAGFAGPEFLFAGFLPASGSGRRKALDALDLPWPVLLFEAPHRVAQTLADLAARFGGAREVVIGRELTKKFEEVARLPLGEALAWLAAAPHRAQGEFVLVLAPGEPKGADMALAEKLLDGLLGKLSPSDAAKLVAKLTGAPKAMLYRRALDRSKQTDT
ncbi:MAG: 16S rRNA (cytidine(1402)-2'-O)-methyltransferase [Betaproteobacteria bacterium]